MSNIAYPPFPIGIQIPGDPGGRWLHDLWAYVGQLADATGVFSTTGSWVDQTSSRAIGTEYTNTDTNPRLVSVSWTTEVSGVDCVLQVDDGTGYITIATGYIYSAGAVGFKGYISAIVPSGSKYKVTGTGHTIVNWAELSYVSSATPISATWGSISGTLSDQADVQSALDSKYDEIAGTNGNFLEFATSGTTVADSGYSATSFATAAQGTLADSAVQPADSVTTLDMSTGKLLGRSTAGAGAVEEITVGTGLSLSAGTLSASGGSSSPLTTKGDLWGFDTADNRIPVGTDGYVLTADSTQALGVKWAAGGGGGSDAWGTTSGTGFWASGTVPPSTLPTATGAHSLALGEAITGTNGYAIAIGQSYVGSTGGTAINIGYTTSSYGATGSYSIAIGYQAHGSGSNSIAIGRGNTASASDSTTLGYSNTASILGGTAIGLSSTASTNNGAVAIGYGQSATSSTRVAIGYSTTNHITLGTDGSFRITGTAPQFIVPTYTLATLPTGITGGIIYVSDATGSGVTGSLCFYNGTNYIDVTTGIAVA